MSKKLNSLDLAFLSLETSNAPINVASLSIFDMPKRRPKNYLRYLLDQLTSQPATFAFRKKLNSVHTSALLSWCEDSHFDIHYHVRHLALPNPGTLSQLLELTARLHGQALDRSRPLWEFYLIEGLQNHQFAIYFKMHHAAIDGMGGIELMRHWLKTSPSNQLIAPWSCMPTKTSEPNRGIIETTLNLPNKLLASSKMVQDLSRLLTNQYFKTVGWLDTTSPVPFTAPRTLFNRKINATRSFAVTVLALDEIVAVAKHCSETINDVVLSLCSGAIRNYLLDKQALPDRSLIASVPVSVCNASHSGNQITYVMVNLETAQSDCYQRVSGIGRSAKEAKKEIHGISPAASTNFAFLAQGLVATINQLNLSALMPPAANLVISNVPGPNQAMYLGRSTLNAMYPMSVLIDGQALNITVMSYRNSMYFGVLACKDLVSDVEMITHNIDIELLQLQRAVLSNTPPID